MTKGKAYISEYEDGSLHIEYTDYSDTGSVEANYSIDSENRIKLETMLRSESRLSHPCIKDLIIEVFGECLDQEPFAFWCDRHQIKYKQFIWIE